jgi:endo-1,4-beta-xylanase
MKAAFTGVLAAALLSGVLANASSQPSLKEVFQHDFLIGAAVNQSQFSGAAEGEVGLIGEQFNSISPENTLKWGSVHPAPNTYDFANSDRYVEFGQRRGMSVIGHTLVWHNQTPAWVFMDQEGKSLAREALLERMRDHIHTVVGRYKGKIHGWDVVNEALDGDGSLRRSPWMKIIGEDYIVKAYQFAHAADPGAELYYNDYSLEDARKREGAVTLVKSLQAAWVALTGIGLQGHYSLDWPRPREIEKTLQTFSNLGLKVMITELDVNVLPTPAQSYAAEVSMHYAADPKWNPYTNGLPKELEQRLARRYKELFQTFIKERGSLSRVTFWGVTDRNSWLNNWPIRGRTNYPLLFDRNGHPKAAFHAVVEARRKGPGPRPDAADERQRTQ